MVVIGLFVVVVITLLVVVVIGLLVVVVIGGFLVVVVGAAVVSSLLPLLPPPQMALLTQKKGWTVMQMVLSLEFMVSRSWFLNSLRQVAKPFA